jgi:hypothetical protein
MRARPAARAARGLGAVLALTLVLATGACAGDDGDGGGGDVPSSASATSAPPADADLPETVDDLIGVCQAITPDEVSGIVGVDGLVVEATPAGSGCVYYEEGNLLDGAVTLTEIPVDEAGPDLEQLVPLVSVGVEGAVEQLDVGDAAFVVAGAFGAGTAANGAVAVGDDVVQLTYLPPPGTSPDDARPVAVSLLELVASRL